MRERRPAALRRTASRPTARPASRARAGARSSAPAERVLDRLAGQHLATSPGRRPAAPAASATSGSAASCRRARGSRSSAAVTVRGSSAMPQIGQVPGASRTISGCIGQVHSSTPARAVARDGRGRRAAGTAAGPCEIASPGSARELLAAARRCRRGTSPRRARRGRPRSPAIDRHAADRIAFGTRRRHQAGQDRAARFERKHAAVMSQFDCSGMEQLREPPRTPSEDAKITLAVLASRLASLAVRRPIHRCRQTT